MFGRRRASLFISLRSEPIRPVSVLHVLRKSVSEVHGKVPASLGGCVLVCVGRVVRGRLLSAQEPVGSRGHRVREGQTFGGRRGWLTSRVSLVSRCRRKVQSRRSGYGQRGVDTSLHMEGFL